MHSTRSWIPRSAVAVSLIIALFFSAPVVAQDWVVTGAVVNSDGEGIPDVDIDIADSGGVSASLSGDLTTSDGTFSLTILDVIPSGFYCIEYNAPELTNYITHVDEVFLIGDADLVDVELARQWEVSGSVVDADGVGISGVDLQFVDQDGLLHDFSPDDTDVDGNYMLMVIEGVWDIEYRSVDIADPLVPVQRLDVSITEDTILEEITMVPGYTVTGVVEDSGSTPLDGIDVEVVEVATGSLIASGSTDVDGAIEFLLPAGDHEFEFAPTVSSGYASELVIFFVDADAASNDLGTIVLQDGVEVTGTVLDDASLGVVDVDLDFVVASTEDKVHSKNDNSDVDGNYSVIVPDGTYDIRYRPPFDSGLAPVVSQDVVVSGTTALDDVTLPDGIALTGVVTAAGVDVSDVLVTLSDSTSGDPAYAFGNRTAVDGSYGIRQVSATYDVLFTPTPESGYDPATVLDVDLSMDTVLDIDLAPVGDVEFVRGDSNGSAVVDLADPIYLLRYIFNDGSIPPCMAGADRNGDGTVDIADAIGAFTWLFGSGAEPAEPFPDCGVDTLTTLLCDTVATMCE